LRNSGAEVSAQGIVHSLLHLAMAGRITGQIHESRLPIVAGEDQHRVVKSTVRPWPS